MRRNVAGQVIGAQLNSATDGSAFTGAVTVAVTIDGGTQATGTVGSGACTHEGGGYHTYTPSQAETNGALVAYTFSGTGAIPVTIQVYTRPATGLLAPTVADRTLDVSSGGEAGIDWANVGSPSTVVGLTGTVIGSIFTNGISAGSISTGAFTAAKFAAGAIDAAAIGTGAITASKFAAGAIDAAAIAADAIGADEISAAAVTKIQTGLATPTNITAGTITTVTNLTNLPAIPTNWLTAAGLASDAVTEIAGGVTGSLNDLDAAGVRAAVGLATANLDTQIATLATSSQANTILARLGSWTGSGINNVLGAFRALMAKASALTPTDISTSTTYDNTTDSLEALRDRGDAAWITGTGGGGGGGSSVILGSANTITRNINEQIPIQFTWTSASATITATVELGTASAVACQGAVSFVRTDTAGLHWYQLAYDADDRPTTSGLARYVFTDGTSEFTVPVQFTEVASGGGGGISLPFAGAVADRVEGTKLQAFFNENTPISIAVVDSSGNAVTVTGRTLRVSIEDKKGVDKLIIADGSITKSGSTVTFTVTTAVTATPTSYYWSLRDITSGNVVLLQGVLDVVYAAEADA